MLTRRRGLGERGDKILCWRHSNCTHYDACRRETAECSQRRSEVRAGRLSSRFRLRAYRTVHTSRPVSSRCVHHGIFPDFYFYTHSLQRTHERRPMASRREQVSALFVVASTQRRLTECFPWATEGPNPPKETLTFKKDFFWQTTSGSLPTGLNPFACALIRKSAVLTSFCLMAVTFCATHIYSERGINALSNKTKLINFGQWNVDQIVVQNFSSVAHSTVDHEKRFSNLFHWEQLGKVEFSLRFPISWEMGIKFKWNRFSWFRFFSIYNVPGEWLSIIVAHGGCVPMNSVSVTIASSSTLC